MQGEEFRNPYQALAHDLHREMQGLDDTTADFAEALASYTKYEAEILAILNKGTRVANLVISSSIL
jgi:hypothetical protein